MVTEKEYNEATDCPLIPGLSLRFQWNFISAFLEALGYEIILHKGIAKITETISHPAGSVQETGKTWDDERTTVLAIKSHSKLPERLDSEDCKKMFVITVFEDEYKQLLIRLAKQTRMFL